MRSPRRIHPLILALLCAVIPISALAQSSQYKPGSPVLMWKVSSKTNSAYLLGSVHLGDKSLYPLPAVVENAFKAASVLIVEVDIKKIDQMQVAQLMAASGTYPDGDDLFKHITPETRAKLAAFLSPYGIPPEAFAKTRPWALGLTLAVLPIMKAGLNVNDGIDSHFLNTAGSKRVEQLEDAAFQVKLLSEMPERISDEWLSAAISQAESMKVHWTKLESFWAQGDAGKIDDLMAAPNVQASAEEKAFARRLREDRNPHMADRLEQCLHSQESCFMVVGAAHVVGREGIVKLMQTRGYHIEQAVVEASIVQVPATSGK